MFAFHVSVGGGVAAVTLPTTQAAAGRHSPGAPSADIRAGRSAHSGPQPAAPMTVHCRSNLRSDTRTSLRHEGLGLSPICGPSTLARADDLAVRVGQVADEGGSQRMDSR